MVTSTTMSFGGSVTSSLARRSAVGGRENTGGARVEGVLAPLLGTSSDRGDHKPPRAAKHSLLTESLPSIRGT